MKISDFDCNEKVFIIAEIGNNHEGDFSLAQKLVEKAAEAGADAVKFQTFIPELFVSSSDKVRMERLKKFQLKFEEFKKLSELAKERKLIFLSTPLDMESAIFLNEIVPAFKISSSDNTFLPLIKYIANTKKPIILSAGLTTYEEIKETRDYIYKIWNNIGVGERDLAILHCVSAYPTPHNEVNLNILNSLKRLEVTIGYSDHTMGVDAAILSVALGARIIEKHFTIDKNYSDFRDHQLSADVQDLKIIVEKVRLAEKLLGSEEKVLQNCERNSLPLFRRSIVSKKDLPKGTKMSFDDLAWVRPAGGISPGEEFKIIGKTTKITIPQYGLIKLEDLI